MNYFSQQIQKAVFFYIDFVKCSILATITLSSVMRVAAAKRTLSLKQTDIKVRDNSSVSSRVLLVGSVRCSVFSARNRLSCGTIIFPLRHNLSIMYAKHFAKN